MKPAPFEYVRPSTVEEALLALRTHAGNDAKLLAGGQSLVPMMNFRVLQPAVIIDINRLHDLAYIRESDDHLAVGALTRHAALKSSNVIAEHAPMITAAYEHVAHATIRNRGTIGGNLAHADAASEMPAVMCALDATMVLRRHDGSRTVKAREFFLGVFATALEADELLVEIRVPKRAAGEWTAFEEMNLRKGDFAMAAVAVKIRMIDGRCDEAVVYLTGVSDRPVRIEGADRKLAGSRLLAEEIAAAAEAVAAEVEFGATASVSAAYRKDLTRVLIVRALADARDRSSEEVS
jgi:aerobic carbon-monoxide dehydrogenase medium subunit